MSGEGCEAWRGQGAIMAGRGRTENDLGCPLLHSRVIVSGGVASGDQAREAEVNLVRMDSLQMT